jgi:two-component system OmpR family response regulator
MGKRNGQAKWADKQVFTTGEAAEICKVSQQTIIRCFDSGRLGGFRVPGSRFRRIPRAELMKFMKANDIPSESLESATKRILVVDDDSQIIEMFQDAFAADDRYEIRTAATGYDAGILTEQFRPHLILLDYMLPDINGNLVCQRIKSNADLQETKVLFVSGVVKQDEIDHLDSYGADGFIKKPFDLTQLMSEIEHLLQA